MATALDFEKTVQRLCVCRLTGQNKETRRLLSELSKERRTEPLSILQKNIIAIEKSQFLTNVGLSRRAETALRKAVRASSCPLKSPHDLIALTHAVLLGNMAFVRMNTKGEFERSLKIEEDLRKTFLDVANVDVSKLGFYVGIGSFIP